MTEDQKDLLEEARDSISAADLLLAGGFPGYAVSRAYYAMFYVAEAFLEGLGLSFSKHSAVIAAFGQHFAQTGKVPAEFHRFLLEAFELRHKGDYACAMPLLMTKLKSRLPVQEGFLNWLEISSARCRR